MEVLPRVELGSQGFAVPHVTVPLKHRILDQEDGLEPPTCRFRVCRSTN
jgi:hypothetical protein